MKTFNYKYGLRSAVSTALACLTILATAPPRQVVAAGLLIADGGLGGVLEIKEHDVRVAINNGIAVTRVTQVFRNTEKRQVEALYTFPVPKGASVANFSMWINGKEVVGEVVEKKRAREIYNSYKRQRRDPGLLEQVDYKSFEMRIFPIAAEAEQKVEIVYYQQLEIDHDEAVYVYPLATVTRKGIDSRITGKFALNVEIKSEIPIVSVKSPSHGDDFVTVQHTESVAQASLEAQGGDLSQDVVLNCAMSRPKTGIDVITSNRSGEDGYFCLTLTVGKDLAKLNKGMDYIFLLDVSGSMSSAGKLIVSKEAVQAFVEQLGPEDRFEIMTFNVTAVTLFGELAPGDDEKTAEAGEWLATRRARGGTLLAPAMKAAYRYADPDRQLNVVVLSDGMTDQGERRQLLDLIRARPGNSHVFCIGVGNEVNRPLLEQLAQDSGGLAAFVSRGDNFERAARSFRRKLMRPVARDIQIEIKGVEAYDVEPSVLPNLYHGSPVRLYGRYRRAGDAEVVLRASVQGVALKKSATLKFPAQNPANPEIERMWAWQRVDRLLKRADRTGSRVDVLDEIIRLGEGYSIVTEYTSFLVLENDAEYKRWKIERRNALRIARDRKAQAALRVQLERLKSRAATDVGPAPDAPAVQPRPQAPPRARPAPATPATPIRTAQRTPNRNRGIDLDFGGGMGGGPVGPLFIAFLLWLRGKREPTA